MRAFKGLLRQEDYQRLLHQVQNVNWVFDEAEIGLVRVRHLPLYEEIVDFVGEL